MRDSVYFNSITFLTSPDLSAKRSLEDQPVHDELVSGIRQ